MVRLTFFRFASLALAAAGAALVAAPAAQAQFRGGYAFLQAVEDRDGTKTSDALKDDAAIVNTRHPDNGETALIIVVKRRDATWLRFLMGKGGDPSIGDKQGMTPLMHAALLNSTEMAEDLLTKAPVDQANRRGETALILAVQARNSAVVRLLVKRGADPDKADHIAGMSARDYAKRDDRSGQLLAMLDASADDAPTRELGSVFGPQ